MASDDYTVEMGAKAATRMVKNAVPRDEIVALLREELSKKEAEEAYEVARLRNKATDRFQDPLDLWFDEAGLRYATPDTVARARAQRLAEHGDTAVDLACGAGIQLVFLAEAFDQACGIEIDPGRAELARRNLTTRDLEAEVIIGDCLDPGLREEIGPTDVLVCDPARDARADERILDDLAPDPRKVLDRWQEGAQAWCIELPPMMPPERVAKDLDGELEYTSLNRDLNRLAVYGGQAAEVERSALVLPEGERLTDQDEGAAPETVDAPGEYAFLVDRTALQADLLPQLVARAGATGLLLDDHPRRHLLTGDQPSGTTFCTDHRVLATEAWNLELLRGRLERLEAGKVTLRASIDPDDYWTVRNALEKDLDGDRHVHLFNLGSDGMIVETLDEES